MYHGLHEVHNARVLFVDMNSFFASVAQQRNPALRDRAVAVASHTTDKGTILAASYEAKAFGVRTGMKVGIAREHCPGLIAMEPEAGHYREVHEKFMTILRDLYGPEVIPKSIDEAAIFLTPNHYGSTGAQALALEIKERFRQELGEYIRCSIGIAPNMLLAKVASNLKKPNGLTEITLENLEATLSSMVLTDLPGIATARAIQLGSRNICTPLEFYQAAPADLQRWFGIWGQYWWWRLHGYEPDGSSNYTKSISHEHVLPRWISGIDEVRPIIHKMSDRLIYRLQRNQFQCRSVWLYMSVVGAPSIFGERRFDSPTSSYPTLFQGLQELIPDVSQLHGPIRKVTVGFEGLSDQERGLQLDLFERRAGEDQLSKAMFSVRSRFGFQSLQLGSVMTVKKGVAKEQLGFGRIKDRYPFNSHP